MPVYGNAWERAKSILNRFIDWLAKPFQSPDPPDDPEEKP
jgi:hypothetical protein